MLPDPLLHEAARRFALLSDPTRLRILRELHDRGELAVGEIADATEATLPNVSQHLGRLLAGGIVARRREGKAVRYRIVDDTIHAICDVVCASVRERARVLSG